MPDRDGTGSRWSSVREREERNRRRAEERERAKRERLAREAGQPPVTDPDPAGRGLSDEERQTIRAPRFSSTPPPGAAPPERDAEPDPEIGSPDAPAEPASSVGTRWRDSVPPPPSGGDLPNLPGDDDQGPRRGPGSARLIIFGASLLVLIAILAFSPLGPFSDDDEPTLPTPSAMLPSILTTVEADGDGDGPDQVEQPQAAAGQPIVCIDPGHGGWDTGWNRTDSGDNPSSPPITTEAQLNLGMAYMLKEELEEMGMFVVLTRPGGSAVNMFEEDVNGDGETRLNAPNPVQAGDRDELQARINVCNEAEADVLISVHVDGFNDTSVRGFHVFYTAQREFGEQNAALATFVYREMDTALRDTDMANLGLGARPDTDIDYGQTDAGTADHFIMTGPAVEVASIEPSLMPGIIVEAGFLSNDQDAAFLVQPDNQRIVVGAYARGIQAYFNQYPPED